MAKVRQEHEGTVIREAVVRYRGSRRKIESPIRSPADVAAFVRKVVSNDAREHFLSIQLDARHRPVAYQVVSIGTASASLVHPREVYQSAISIGACAIVVAHNHPSEDPSPSKEDVDISRRLSEAGKILGIPLLDSLVVTRFGHVSIRESNPDAIEDA